MYEQYLGSTLEISYKSTNKNEYSLYRKEQGIYYTPIYIVDYIVRNSISRLLKVKNFNIDKIKVLDIACGSGSFLIKTFDFLNNYHRKINKNYSQTKLDTQSLTGTYSKKVEILKNNIYGVDLDKKAVEIAYLNLLIKIAEKRQRLPLLQQNIKNGNSLVEYPRPHLARSFD